MKYYKNRGTRCNSGPPLERVQRVLQWFNVLLMNIHKEKTKNLSLEEVADNLLLKMKDEELILVLESNKVFVRQLLLLQ